MSLTKMGQAAQKAALELAVAPTNVKNNLLEKMAAALITNVDDILAANRLDLQAAATNGMSEGMQDRLRLTTTRIQEMAAGIEQIASLADPIGEVDKMWKNADNLTIGKKRVPLGVIGIIYEARPNVTTDAAALCFKAGNAVILRGGKEAFHSNQALVQIMQGTLKNSLVPTTAIQFVADTSRETATQLMKLDEYLDVLIPRGGAGLIKAVLKNATVPVIETGTGNCHIYVDEAAQFKMAEDIVINAKCQRPSVCNAVETLLVHEKIAPDFLEQMAKALAVNKVEIRADEHALPYFEHAKAATELDWQTEYNDLILAVKVVPSLEAAIDHINTYNTKHSEAIITDNYFASQTFLERVDAAAVYVNASTRFTDGFVFGFGAEIGISNQKMHARGPMGLYELTSTKYIIYGEGQIRH